MTHSKEKEEPSTTESILDSLIYDTERLLVQFLSQKDPHTPSTLAISSALKFLKYAKIES